MFLAVGDSLLFADYRLHVTDYLLEAFLVRVLLEFFFDPLLVGLGKEKTLGGELQGIVLLL